MSSIAHWPWIDNQRMHHTSSKVTVASLVGRWKDEVSLCHLSERADIIPRWVCMGTTYAMYHNPMSLSRCCSLSLRSHKYRKYPTIYALESTTPSPCPALGKVTMLKLLRNCIPSIQKTNPSSLSMKVLQFKSCKLWRWSAKLWKCTAIVHFSQKQHSLARF